ncbi:class I SAM-dependent methyltransferase [Carnobacterium maltaromaticum]|uniref:class I SAM-dependent methyltransferase n=1 Tax=Carnobacterium maltaromaticum TaxID=2751 RepID=UPI00026C836A|nr:class I SAM-dependent methyltransferase [Carnobacterium maltaromaticum]
MGNIDVFNRVASKYDTPERSEIAKITAKEIQKHIVNGKDKTAIDYGCGTGLVGLELVADFETLLFADASQSMVEVVETKIEQATIRNAKTLLLDIEEVSNSDIQVDYIFLVQVLLHVQDIHPLLSNLYKLLKPNGHLLIVDFDYNEQVNSDKVHNGFKQQELIQLMGKIGFVESNAEIFYHGKNIFMNQDASFFILDAAKPVLND